MAEARVTQILYTGRLYQIPAYGQQITVVKELASKIYVCIYA